MIVERRKKNEDLDQIMYSEDFDGGANDNDVQDSCIGEEEVTGGRANKKKKQLTKTRGQSRGKLPKMALYAV
jgi:hypothetical protein